MLNLNIEIADLLDAEEILTLQKLAFRTEAALYADDTIPPLQQTLASLQGEIRKICVLKAVQDQRIIGSIRAAMTDNTCYINRLMVHPAYRRQGLGTRLLQDIEKRFASAKRYQLGTGHLSVNNLRLYQGLGYQEIRREKLNEKVTFVIMEKTNNR